MNGFNIVRAHNLACGNVANGSEVAFDVITKLTFGECFGFLAAGRDLYGLMKRLDETIDEDAPVWGLRVLMAGLT